MTDRTVVTDVTGGTVVVDSIIHSQYHVKYCSCPRCIYRLLNTVMFVFSLFDSIQYYIHTIKSVH